MKTLKHTILALSLLLAASAAFAQTKVYWKTQLRDGPAAGVEYLLVSDASTGVWDTIRVSDITGDGISAIAYNAGTDVLTVTKNSGGTLITTIPTHDAATVADGATIDLTITGQEITAEIAQNGASTGQVLEWNGIGWFPSTPSEGHAPVTVQDGVSLDFTASGTDSQTITGEVKLNPASNPALSIKSGGLTLDLDGDNSYNNSFSGLTATSVQDALDELAQDAHAPATVSDGSTVDLAIIGQDITAELTGSSTATAGQAPLSDGAGGITWAAVLQNITREDFTNQTGASVTTSGTLPAAAARIQVFRNGLLQLEGADYNRSSNTITFTTALAAENVYVTWF